jgi:hypothetical protein
MGGQLLFSYMEGVGWMSWMVMVGVGGFLFLMGLSLIDY